MRHNPIAVIAIPISIYCYALTREIGHWISAAVLGLPVSGFLRVHLLPSFNVNHAGPGISRMASILFTISGPGLALLAGYILLGVILKSRVRMRSLPGFLLAFTCYLCLILDPVYYTVIPCARLGGEPEVLARSGISPAATVVVALGLLIINLVLVRTRMVPRLKEG
jgi:hypothetical protein